MWWTLGGSVAAALSFVVMWYWLFSRWNRRRAQRLLVKIESAFGGNGQVSSVHWVSSSQFLISLRLADGNFMQPSVTVRLLPREMPLSWVHCIWKKRRETLTFDANLLCPPGFNLEVQNQRWSGKGRKRLLKKSSVVRLKHVGPFVLTSRRDWQRDITSMMHALAASRDCDLLSVSFRRTTPHFSATIPLEAIAGQECAPVRIFEALRELASGASAARF
jgi:hypothetical protein